MKFNIKTLLTQPTNELGRWSRFLIFQVRIWFHCLRLLKINRCGTQAAALAYHTLFGLVPLAIVGLMVFQMFPAFRDVSEKVKEFAYDYTGFTTIVYPAGDEPDAEEVQVVDKIEELSEGFISKAHTGAITVVGLVLVIWAGIALLTTIEKTFNTIYHVAAGRNFLHRLFNYWALMTLGPILLGLGIYLSSQVVKNELYQKFVPLKQQQTEVEVVTADDVTATDPNAVQTASRLSFSNRLQGGVLWLKTKMGPFFINMIAIFFLYFFLPNTRVNPSAAMWGAFVAAVIWTVAKYGFSQYVTKFVPQFAVYGVLGIIPITVLWIYISWLIVLFGLQLTYASQHIKRLDAAQIAKARKQEQCFLANDQTVIRIMEYILNAFERKDQKPVSVEAVAYRMGMPESFTEKILNHMVAANLLCRTDDPGVGYVPSTDGTHITLDEISTAISEASFAQADQSQSAQMQRVFDEVRQLLSRHSLKEVLSVDEQFDQQHPQGFESQDDEYV